MQPKVIIIGAGPVGLLTAIQTKLYQPDLPILVLEKYREYQRKHPLLINKSSFADAPRDEAFQKFVHDLPEKIRTNELEDKLLEYAQQLGIKIEYKHIEDCTTIRQDYPTAEWIVGADGSHSKVHEQIFNHEYQIKKTLQYIAEIKYDVEGKTRAMFPLSESVLALKYSNHLVSEFVGKENNGKTPVSLRIFVDENAYKLMQAATFKNPYQLTDHEKMDADLYQTIQIWLTAREDMVKEVRIKNSEKISVTHLPVYASQSFVKIDDNKTWFLVGDAAFGMPYFRSLNNGILCSSELAKAIDAELRHCSIETEFLSTSKLSKLSKREQTPAEYYRDYVQSLVKSENFVAEMKNFGVNSLESTATSLHYLPQKSVKFSFTNGGRDFKQHVQEIKQTESSNYFLFNLFSRDSKEDNDVLSYGAIHVKKSCSVM